MPKLGNLTKKQLYLKAIELNPNDANAYYNLGIFLVSFELKIK